MNKKIKSRYRNEVTTTFNKYRLFNGNHIASFGDSEIIKFFFWFLVNGKIQPFDHPDGYIKVNNKILVIEHFTIDCYDTYPNGGSMFQNHESKTEKEFRNMQRTETGKHLIKPISVPASYKSFIDNCRSRFNNHYNQISCYKKHLLDKGLADNNTEFTTCFLMEDVSPFGALSCDEETLQPVCLARSKDFLDFISSKSEVDLIFSAFSFNGVYYPYIFTQHDLASCYTNVLDYANFHFLSSNNTMEVYFEKSISSKDLSNYNDI